VARPDWIHFTLKRADRLEARRTIALAHHRPRNLSRRRLGEGGSEAALHGAERFAPLVATDHLFRTSLLKRFLQGLSQFGYADLGEGDTIFVIGQ